jgi:hypothetical protein
VTVERLARTHLHLYNITDTQFNIRRCVVTHVHIALVQINAHRHFFAQNSHKAAVYRRDDPQLHQLSFIATTSIDRACVARVGRVIAQLYTSTSGSHVHTFCEHARLKSR